MSEVNELVCPICNGSGTITAKSAGTGSVMAAQRKRIGITQKELADRSGLTRDIIASIEKGRVNAKLAHIRPIAQALGVDVGNLIP